MDLAAVGSGLAFVVTIIDPKKYQKAAAEVLDQEDAGGTGGTDLTRPAGEFLDAFLHLERLIRDFLKTHDLYVPQRANSTRVSYSNRQMIDALLQNEKVERPLFNELLEIGKYRNLVFHGHVAQVRAGMLKRVRAAAGRIEALG